MTVLQRELTDRDTTTVIEVQTSDVLDNPSALFELPVDRTASSRLGGDILVD
jgi:hypothetical protein